MSQENKQLYINDEYYVVVKELGYEYYVVQNKEGKYFIANFYDLSCPNGGYSTLTGVLIPLKEELVKEDMEKAIEEAREIRKRITIIYN